MPRPAQQEKTKKAQLTTARAYLEASLDLGAMGRGFAEAAGADPRALMQELLNSRKDHNGIDVGVVAPMLRAIADGLEALVRDDDEASSGSML